jgi:uncharacterized protein YcbX
MTVVGTVASLGRYPVKSMQGEFPSEVEIGPTGMVGDRMWGVVKTENGNVMSGKKYGTLLEAFGHTDGGSVSVTLPDGNTYTPGDDADAALSAWLGLPVALRPAPETATPYEMSFNVDDESVDEFEWPTPPGSFVDLAAAHILTSAALAAAADAYPDGNWSVHRFRPGVFIDTDATGFIENEWTGKGLQVGDVVFDIAMPTIRCTMTTKAQPEHGIARDVDIFKSLKNANSQNLGAYAGIRTPGVIRVGDPVTLLD